MLAPTHFVIQKATEYFTVRKAAKRNTESTKSPIIMIQNTLLFIMTDTYIEVMPEVLSKRFGTLY